VETLSALVILDVWDPCVINLGEKASAAVAAIMARDIDRKSLPIVAVVVDFEQIMYIVGMSEWDANDSQ